MERKKGPGIGCNVDKSLVEYARKTPITEEEFNPDVPSNCQCCSTNFVKWITVIVVIITLCVLFLSGCAPKVHRETINGQTFEVKTNECWTGFFGCEEREISREQIDFIPLQYDDSYEKK